MISGTDIVIPAVGDAAALDLCTRIVQLRWPHARFEDAVTGEKYAGYGTIPLGHVRELFAYPNETAEAAWDADNPDSAPNSMLYFILSAGFVTVVVDDPNTEDMRAMLDAFRSVLLSDYLNNPHARAA